MFWVFNDQSTKRAKELWPLQRAFLIGCFPLCFCLVFSRLVNDIGWVVVSLCLRFHTRDTDVTTFSSASFSGFKAMVKISCIGGLVDKLCLTLTTPWAVACQVPLPMGFPRQEYWSGLSFSSPEDLPDPRIRSTSPALQSDSLPLNRQGSPNFRIVFSLSAENFTGILIVIHWIYRTFWVVLTSSWYCLLIQVKIFVTHIKKIVEAKNTVSFICLWTYFVCQIIRLKISKHPY